MKKYQIVSIIAVCCLAIVLAVKTAMATYTPIQTPDSFMEFRSVSADDDTGPTSTVWADITGVNLISLKTGGAVLIRMRATGAAGTIGNWCIYAAKEDGEPWEYVAHGTATTGTTATGNTDEYWCYAISITNKRWSKFDVTPGYLYNMGTGAVANGGIAVLNGDGREYKHWKIYMEKGTTTTIGADIGSYR